jgi:Uma2 family endonuclease
MVMKLELTPRPVPKAPSEERWREMTKAERERFIVSVNEALSDPLITMSEGRPHKKAKSRALDMLGLHFRAMGRRIYLAEELSVIYPNETPFTPDVLAVLEIEEPEDDERMSWVVQDEGKGLDWALEVVYAGNRNKDLVDNVERYATLGIPEYFIYDKKQERIFGYRLPPGTRRYQPIIAQAGLYRSNVLGIDLAIVDGRLKFYQGAAELYDTAHLIRRLEGMVTNLERKNDETAREAEKNRVTIRDTILAILAARGVTCKTETLEQLHSCIDADILKRWVTRALTATSEADVFLGE